MIAGLSVDELSARSGIPSRTIRFYQTQGAMPAPRRVGRRALYSEEHVERLRLITLLQSRGLRLRAIADLVGCGDPTSTSVGSWLGLDATLASPWSEDAPQRLDDREVRELLGARHPEAVAPLVAAGALVPRADGGWLVPSPALLGVLLELEDVGVSIATAAGAGEILRRGLRRAADDLVAHFAHHVGGGFGRDAGPAELAGAIEALRSRGIEAARLIFAQEMQRSLRLLVDAPTRSDVGTTQVRSSRRWPDMTG